MTTIDTERTGFLRAIIADPADDTVRLIYADKLDESGEHERAEFIRLQIERERYEESLKGEFLVLPESPKGKRLQAYREREQAILDKGSKGSNWFDWAPAPIHKWSVGRMDNLFRRGFVSKVRTSFEAWCEHWEEFRECTPLEEVELLTVPQLIEQIEERGNYIQVTTEGHLCGEFIYETKAFHSTFSRDWARSETIRLCLQDCRLWRGITFVLPEPDQ